MRIVRLIFVLVAIFSTQPIFAEDMSSDSKPCAAIADACTKAGFVRADASDKKFWKNCMKPIILGQTVKDVTVDAATVKACRANKIEKLKKELQEFQNVSSKKSS